MLEKLILYETLATWRKGYSGKLVVTNGCFDILHTGHVAYLESAAGFGDSLLVGINDNASVRALKGLNRPINDERDRATVIAGLGCVSFVCIFGPSAGGFLSAAKPNIYVKGGDYSLETINREERLTLEAAGAQIRFIPLILGRSTSRIIALDKKASMCPSTSWTSFP